MIRFKRRKFETLEDAIREYSGLEYQVAFLTRLVQNQPYSVFREKRLVRLEKAVKDLNAFKEWAGGVKLITDTGRQ